LRDREKRKVGRAVRTAFDREKRKVGRHFPAWERKLEVHDSLLSHLEISGRKSSTLDFVMARGRPR
jgi:hypothetical protein